MPVFAAIGAMGVGGAAAIGAGASLIGAGMQSSAAKKAAGAQERAGRDQIALQREIFDETSANFKPFLDSGRTGNEALMFELGLGPRPTFGGTAPTVETFSQSGPGQDGGGPNRGFGDIVSLGIGGLIRRNNSGGSGGGSVDKFRVNGQVFDTMEAAQAFANANRTGGGEYQGFQKTPGYDFQMSQGMDAIQSTAAARGNLLSGSTIQGAQTFGQGLANQEYGNFLNRLTGVSASGQAAAGNQASAGANFAANAGNAMAGIGNAQAAGAIGSANAFSSGLNNVLGSVGYMQGMNSGFQPNNNAPTTRPRANPFFGGM